MGLRRHWAAFQTSVRRFTCGSLSKGSGRTLRGASDAGSDAAWCRSLDITRQPRLISDETFRLELIGGHDGIRTVWATVGALTPQGCVATTLILEEPEPAAPESERLHVEIVPTNDPVTFTR
jgi:hypothetical protein